LCTQPGLGASKRITNSSSRQSAHHGSGIIPDTSGTLFHSTSQTLLEPHISTFPDGKTGAGLGRAGKGRKVFQALPGCAFIRTYKSFFPKSEFDQLIRVGKISHPPWKWFTQLSRKKINRPI
jgi:hypothetical protein